MKQLLILLSVCSFLFTACGDDTDTMPEPEPGAVTISVISASVVTGSGSSDVNLVTNQADNVDPDSEFTVTFSKAVLNTWLENASLPKITLMENDLPVTNVSFNVAVLSTTQIRLTPDAPLDEGAAYELVINAGYVAEDGGELEAAVSVEFETYMEVIPDPLTITRINGTIWNGMGFEGIDLITTMSNDVSNTSEFIVTFSEPVQNAWLSNESLPEIMRMESGNPVENIDFGLTVLGDNEIILSPDNPLTNGTTYMIVINAGYEAVAGGVLEDAVTVEFETYVPDPLTVSSIVASDGMNDVSMDDQSEAADVPVDAAFTVTFSNTVFITSENEGKFALELLINDVVDSQVAIDLEADFINRTVTVTPAVDLATGSTYQLVLREGLEHDLGGTLESDYIAPFTTEN